MHPHVDTVFPAEMLLSEALTTWDQDAARYRLVINEDGLMKGIIDRRQLFQHMAISNEIERERWAQMTVGSLTDTLFSVPCPSPSQMISVSTTPLDAAVGIHDRCGQIALQLGEELYVNWSRVSATLKASHIDPVTQLPTRLAFERRIQEELDRASRSQQAISIMLVDLDHLKQINDNFGHAAGDMALRLVADYLRLGFRSYDFVARYGGDEFAGTCFDCGPDKIHLPVQRIQRALAHQYVTYLNQKIPVSISIGIATLHAVTDDSSAANLLHQADLSLYAAKRAGRSTAFGVEVDATGMPQSQPRCLDTQR